MKYLRLTLWFLIMAVLLSCEKEEKRVQEQKSPEAGKTEQTKQAPGAAQKENSVQKGNIPSSRVAIMPIACVDGSYATANYQNRHFFPAFTNMLLEVYGDIKTPGRQAILEKACGKKMITRQFYALRRKDHDLKEAAAFGREIDAEFLVLPSLKGDDTGLYEFHVRIIKTSREDRVIWEKSWNVQTSPYDYLATLQLYESAAISTAEFFLEKKSPAWVASQGNSKAQNLLEKAREKRKSLLLNDMISSVHLLYSAVKEDPGYPDAWAALSEAYTALAYHLINTNTEIAYELALRANLASVMALRLNANSTESIRAAFLSAYVNINPPLMDKYKKAYLEKDPKSPLALLLNSLKMEESDMEKAFRDISPQPHFAILFYQHLPGKISLPIMAELYKQNPESSPLCNVMVNLNWDVNFVDSEVYAAHNTYLAQKQFLEVFIPLTGARSGKKADQALEEIKQAIPAATPELENEKKTWDLAKTLQSLNHYYHDQVFIYYKDSTALKVLGTCGKLLSDYETELNKDSLKKEHFFDSPDLTERDEIVIWQRELLRGPLNILTIVSHRLGEKQVAQQIVPELEKIFPEDILVLRSGFNNIYKLTGFGPTGTYYLTKLNDRYLDNIDVQSYVQDNYIQAEKHPRNTTMARYFTYIASDPGNPSILSRAYNHLFRLEEKELAGKVLNLYQRQYPKDKWVIREVLQIKRSGENRFSTIDEIRQVYPDDIDGLYELWDAAALYRENGYFDKALNLYIRANEKAPQIEGLARQLGWSWRLAGEPGKSLQTLENCAKLNGHNLTACGLLESIAYDSFFSGEIEKARLYYIKANNIDSYYGGCILGRGYLWHADGDPKKAEEQFQMHHERYGSPAGPSLICRMLLKQGRIEEALERINQYMQNQQFRNYYEPHRIKAECVYRLGRPEEALNIIKGCADVLPGDMDSRCDLAYMYLRLGKPEKAVEYLESELKKKELGHGQLLPMYCAIIRAYLEKKSPYDAIPYIHKCRFFVLDNDASLATIGLYEFETGKNDEAGKYLESAIRVNPIYTFPRATFVFLETKEGRVDQAIQVGEQGLKSCIFDDDTRLYFALAEAYLKKGENPKAVPLLEQIIAIDGKTSHWGTRAVNLLEKIPR